MGRKIKVTSERLPRIRVTSDELEKIDPESVARALSAESRGKMTSDEIAPRTRPEINVVVGHFTDVD